MTMYYIPVIGVIAAVVVFAFVEAAVAAWIAFVAATAAFAMAVTAWMYSPLPNSNGGLAATGDRGRYWGFSDDRGEE